MVPCFSGVAGNVGEDGLLVDAVGLIGHSLVFQIDGREGTENLAVGNAAHPHRHVNGATIVRLGAEAGADVVCRRCALFVVEVGIGVETAAGESQFVGRGEGEVGAVGCCERHGLS